MTLSDPERTVVQPVSLRKKRGPKMMAQEGMIKKNKKGSERKNRGGQ
jgi:hypothetical protein